MGLTGKSLFRRRNRKTKKKLAESQVLLDNLAVQLDETEKYETQLQLQLSEKQKHLQNALQTKNSLLERVKRAKERLERVVKLNREAETKLEEQKQRHKMDVEVCLNLETFHKELPVTVWNLQAQICKSFRLIENTKQDISSASLQQERRREKIEMKREELIRSHIKIKATKKKISKAKSEIKKIAETKRMQEFHKKCMETLVVYVMQMNLRAANSRIKMVERRGRHLQKMLDGIKREADMYTCLANEMKKRSELQARSVKMHEKFSSFDVGVA